MIDGELCWRSVLQLVPTSTGHVDGALTSSKFCYARNTTWWDVLWRWCCCHMFWSGNGFPSLCIRASINFKYMAEVENAFSYLWPGLNQEKRFNKDKNYFATTTCSFLLCGMSIILISQALDVKSKCLGLDWGYLLQEPCLSRSLTNELLELLTQLVSVLESKHPNNHTK